MAIEKEHKLIRNKTTAGAIMLNELKSGEWVPIETIESAIKKKSSRKITNLNNRIYWFGHNVRSLGYRLERDRENQAARLVKTEEARRTNWPVQDAKTRLSEVMEEAESKGPQIITRHGEERAVLLSIRDYRALTAHKPNLRDYLLGGPKVDSFKAERDRDVGRKISL